jgi:hypothetical protein
MVTWVSLDHAQTVGSTRLCLSPSTIAAVSPPPPDSIVARGIRSDTLPRQPMRVSSHGESHLAATVSPCSILCSTLPRTPSFDLVLFPWQEQIWANPVPMIHACHHFYVGSRIRNGFLDGWTSFGFSLFCMLDSYGFSLILFRSDKKNNKMV